MKTNKQWKSTSRLDTIMNILLIVLALGVLGGEAVDVEANLTHIASLSQQRV